MHPLAWFSYFSFLHWGVCERRAQNIVQVIMEVFAEVRITQNDNSTFQYCFHSWFIHLQVIMRWITSECVKVWPLALREMRRDVLVLVPVPVPVLVDSLCCVPTDLYE